MSWPWGELGLDGPASLEEVRQAYAQRLKQTHPEEDPEGFQRLHEAYQEARRLARQAQGKGRRPPVPFGSGAHPRTADRPEPPGHPQQPKSLEGQGDSEEQEAPGRQFQFDSLLQQDRKEEPPEKQETPSQQFQFDNLLQQEETPEQPARFEQPEQKEQWDFDRLFQEAEAQQEKANQQKYGDQGQAVGQALELVRLLLQDNLPRTDWERFLASRLFFQVRGIPAFIAGLVDAFRTWPVHNPQIRVDLLRAYGLLQETNIPPAYRDLYWVLHGHREAPPKPKKPKSLWSRHPFLTTVALILVLWGASQAAIKGVIYLVQRPNYQQVQTISQYLQEDLGFQVESLYLTTKDESYLNRYRLPVQQLTFSAWPQGERAPDLGMLGYRTDLGNALMTQALERFAAQWEDDCTLELFNEDGAPTLSSEPPATYRIETSLQGASACIEALGVEMERLLQEDWFALLKPSFQLRLSVGYYFTYTAPDEPFDGQELLSYYQNDLTADLVQYMVEESGLAEMDFGDTPHWFEDLGEVVLDERDAYFVVGGVEAETGVTRRLYLYDGAYLISTPADTFHSEMDALEYAHFRGGERIEKPDFHSPWPSIGIYRH